MICHEIMFLVKMKVLSNGNGDKIRETKKYSTKRFEIIINIVKFIPTQKRNLKLDLFTLGGYTYSTLCTYTLHVNGNETRHNVTFPEMAEVGLFQLSVIIIYEA